MGHAATRRTGTALETIDVLARVFRAARDDGFEQTLVHAACAYFDAAAAALIEPAAPGAPPRVLAAYPEPPGTADALMALRVGDDGAPPRVLVVAGAPGRDFERDEVAVAAALAGAAAAGVAQRRLEHRLEHRVEQQSALVRAARTLNRSLDVAETLENIASEAAAILGADIAGVWRRGPQGDVRLEAAHGLPPEALHARVAAGEGLAGRVAADGRPQIATGEAELARLKGPFAGVTAAIGVPMRWHGEFRGVLSVGYTRPHRPDPADLQLLEGFAELAAVAFSNASEHAGLARAARTDGLTGCLNHSALHDALRRETERARRTGRPLALLMIDLDKFKLVNERHGHLAGDEVLRRVGRALRQSVRAYDHVARYGGDEFAVVAPDAAQGEAEEIARRSLTAIERGIADFLERLPEGAGLGGATAGVAEWDGDMGITELLAHVDRALLYGKHEVGPGAIVAGSEPPEWFTPGRFRRRRRAGEPPVTETTAPAEPSARRELDRLRSRARRLALANALAGRIARLSDPEAIADCAVDELHRAFGFSLCAVLRLRDDGLLASVAARAAMAPPGAVLRFEQPREAGVIGRCLREGRPVLVRDTAVDPDYRRWPGIEPTRSEICAPIEVGGEPWGVLNVEDADPDAFGEDEVQLLETIARQVGAALEPALENARLERAYVETAEALATAVARLEHQEPEHLFRVCDLTLAVAGRLGVAPGEMETLRLGAMLHDVGKLTIPGEILVKPGPLGPEERRIVEEHAEAGHRLLGGPGFLERIRPIVRHEHERWDGRGYPDGLAGDRIPLGSRIVAACHAYETMREDRPYRSALTESQARAELRRASGTQFDPAVVDALLAVLGGGE